MYCNSSDKVRIEMADKRRDPRDQAIEQYLYTCMIGPSDFLSLLKVIRLSINGDPAKFKTEPANFKTEPAKIISIKAISSFGNHATIVCNLTEPFPVADDGAGGAGGAGASPIGRIFVKLEGEPLLKGTGVETLVYQQAVGTTQPVFPTSVDLCKQMFVMGDIDFYDLLDADWGEFADKMRVDLNDRGIGLGRKQIKDRLTVFFDKIRKFPDSQAREIRAKYCMIALDLLRDDLIQGFGSTIQKGVLATINIYNTDDEYTIHHGKRVTDPDITKAVFNVLLLVNVVFDNGVVYTVHMEIDRAKVKALIDELRGDGVAYQSVSYWVDDVIKFIHENKDGFYDIVKGSIQNSVNVSLKINNDVVAPTAIPGYLEYLHTSMLSTSTSSSSTSSSSTTPPLHHAAFVFGCKCFTVYDERCSFRQDEDGTFLPIIATLPNNDMVVGQENTEKNDYFVSIKPIFVRLSTGVVKKITDVNFVVNTDFFHCPTYPTGVSSLISQVLGLKNGETINSIGIEYSPDSFSLKLKDEVVKAAEDEEATAVAKAKFDEAMEAMKAMEEEADARARAAAAAAAAAEEEAVSIIIQIKDVITIPISVPNDDSMGSPGIEDEKAKAAAEAKAAASSNAAALVERISSNGSGIVKQALNSICGTFHYLLTPFMKRTGGVATGVVMFPRKAHTGMVTDKARAGMDEAGARTFFFDDNIAINISVVLGYVLKYIENMEKTRKLNEEIGKNISKIGELRSRLRRRDDSPGRMKSQNTELESESELRKESSEKEKANEVHENSIAMYRASNRKIIKDVSEIILRGDDAIIERFGEIIQERERERAREILMMRGRGGKMRTLRRGVKKNTRRSRRRYSKLKKNTQRCRSRKSKTRRR